MQKLTTKTRRNKATCTLHVHTEVTETNNALKLLLLPLLVFLQVIVTLDKGADGKLTQQQHGSLTTRIQPLTQTQDDNIWTN
jgi:hypothetical protein